MQGKIILRILLSVSMWSLQCVQCTSPADGSSADGNISWDSTGYRAVGNDTVERRNNVTFQYEIAPGPDVTIHNESITSSTFTLTWTEISLTCSNFSHYTVFYLPLEDPYGPIRTSKRRKAKELTMNFCGTTGTLTGLYGAVTYRIQVAVVAIYNGQEITGDRSTPINITTLESVPTVPKNLSFFNFINVCATLSVTLTWSRPYPPNGLITQYNVSYSATNLQGEKFYNSSIVDSNNDINSFYTWSDLSHGNYRFSVVAFTNKGAGKTARLMLPRLPSCNTAMSTNQDTQATN